MEETEIFTGEVGRDPMPETQDDLDRGLRNGSFVKIRCARRVDVFFVAGTTEMVAILPRPWWDRRGEQQVDEE